MNNPNGGSVAAARSPAQSKENINPQVSGLDKLPETPQQLFRSLALPVFDSVLQPDPAGKGSPRKQEYGFPWAGFKSWRDARARLQHFEQSFAGPVVWAPFNDSTTNDGPMSLNAYPGRAFIERVTNAGDANLEAKAVAHKPPMPQSPAEGTALWFGIDSVALSTGLSDDAARELARKTVVVTGFVGEPKDPKDSILDARDYGVGLTAEEMPATILSLNRGNKKSGLQETEWVLFAHFLIKSPAACTSVS